MRHILMSLIVSWILATPNLSAQEVATRPFLFKDARSELAAARVRGEADVLLVIASIPGQNERLAGAIAQLGGTIQFRDDDVDYLRARVPVESVEELAVHPALHSLDISKPRTVGRGSGEGSAANQPPIGGAPESSVSDGVVSTSPDTIPDAWPPILTDYPLRNRYSPIGDMRAEEFLSVNPTYDGRGVTIAMIDYNPDMLLPELQVAKNLDGESVPKIAVFQTALDIREGDDGRWQRMTDMVEAAGGEFTYRDSTYQAPHDGLFRIAIFDEARTDSLARAGLDKDVNRDGNPEESSRLFALIWDEDSNDVWVDTDQDLSFTDEKALTDYSARPEFGVFGTDDPETPIRESMGFALQIDDERKLVAINLGMDSHASLVVGAAVGSRGENGRFDGVAPGSRLASVSEGYEAYGQTEAVIHAVKNPVVDLAYFEQGSGITRPYLLRDGRLVPTVIYTRLIEKYGKPLIIPTHNYPVLGAIDDFVLARGAIGIGGHESKDNFFMNHGVRVEHDDNLLVTGGYGPMGDGSLKPDVISPSNYVSTSRGFLEGRAMPGLFQLPPGYTIAGGTSTATPTAAGGVALLISAAKQAGIQYNAHRIKWAVTRGARYVPHISAYKQGNGVINVGAAWEILKELDAGGLMLEITSRAPVKHPYSHLLPTPHRGPGLYERDGWTVGDREERTFTLTRTSGPGGAMTFDVSWAGNDNGTFSAPLTVTLPLDTPTDLPITVAPEEYGVHTAHLTLDHADVPGYAYRTLATIVTPEPLNARNGFTVEKKVEIPRPGMKSLFFQVPEGTKALKIDLSRQEREVSMAVVRPDTRQQRGEIVTPTESRTTTQVISDPMPGMWEVRLSDLSDTRTFDWEQAKKEEPVPPTAATLTVAALAAEVQWATTPTGLGDDETEVTTGEGTSQVWITNRMASFTGGAVSTPIGSAQRVSPTIDGKEQQIFEVEVLPGSTALIARAFNASDPEADLDVYVFDCTGSWCRQQDADADPVGNESVVVSNPAAGKWKIVVDAASVPSGTTTYEYLDVVFNPAYGMVSVTDLPQERARDARWTPTVHTWVAPAALDQGRVPWVAASVQGQEGAGSGFLVGAGSLWGSGGRQ